MKKIWILALLLLMGGRASATDTLVVVIDASGSMNDQKIKNSRMTRMEAVKQALKKTLVKLPPNTDLGILVFSASGINPGTPEEWIYPIGKPIADKVVAAISRVEPHGGTPLGDYIKIGADRLLDRRGKSGNSGRFRLLVVTDGENNEGASPEPMVADAKRKGIEIDLIGAALDGGAEHSLARLVTGLPTPGSYQNAENADSLAETVANMIKEAPMTSSGGIDPILFEEIAPLPEGVASVMVKTLAHYNNTPLGEPDPVFTITQDDRGELQVTVTPEATNGSSLGYYALWVFGGFVGFVVVAILLSLLFGDR
jgi:hypothetical protein